MIKKLAPIFYRRGTALAGVIVITLFGIVHVSSNQQSQFAECAENIMFNHALPMSHPINRCAAQASQSVSWSSWFSGHSSSYQFHFIDLLELLSRPADSSKQTNR